MEERGNKTIMCSVLFLDIVEYSKMSVSGQISLKDRFNSYLSAAIRDMPVADRIILDTGDGAAINFLGDGEVARVLDWAGIIADSDASQQNPPALRQTDPTQPAETAHRRAAATRTVRSASRTGGRKSKTGGKR